MSETSETNRRNSRTGRRPTSTSSGATTNTTVPNTPADTSSPPTQQEISVSPEDYLAENPFPYFGMAPTGRTGVAQDYIPAPRVEYPQTAGRTQGGIIDPDGNLMPYYELSTRPAEILGSLDEVSRKRLTDLLYSRGWYGGSRPSGGFGDSDRQAMENLLYFSNVQGVDYRTVLATVAKAPISEGYGARQVQVASSADLMEIANRTALQTIGRKLSENEAKQFARAYQGVQRSSAGTSENAPSADVFFQSRIQQKYGAESEGYKYLSAISNVAKLLESI